MKAPLIFDVKRTSTADGPGVRTVVFFKGCNLDCFWCHNPEGKRADAEVAFFSEKCVSCGTCRNICSQKSCTACGKCTAYCPANARRLYGKTYTPQELAEIILADRAYYEATGGGVTFSGGECMLYPDYLAAVARICRESGVHVAVDTAGCVPYESFETVLPYVDLFLYDVKCLDSVLHKKGTGVDNALILQNLERLIANGKQIVIRTPVIPDFNEGAEQGRIQAFCAARQLSWEPLPYHSFGEDKKRALKA
ncbi:MAG: glycyl-radical enzyme activating protein [Clostridia bacterium]|nr:glycyl-radical enzyme activating protein [Clostridia bacterium]